MNTYNVMRRFNRRRMWLTDPHLHPPTTGQLAAPSRRGWTWLAAAWPVRCAQHQQQHAAVMTESHGWLYLSSHVLDLKYARITTDRRLEATVQTTVGAEREVSISGCKKSHRRAPFDSEEQTVFNVCKQNLPLLTSRKGLLKFLWNTEIVWKTECQ